MALTRFMDDCSRHLAQRILVRQYGNMGELKTWVDVAETYSLTVLLRNEPGKSPGCWVHAPDVDSGVIYCNTSYPVATQVRVMVHEIAHALMCLIPDLLIEVESGEALIGKLANGRKVRHQIAEMVVALCITH